DLPPHADRGRRPDRVRDEWCSAGARTWFSRPARRSGLLWNQLRQVAHAYDAHRLPRSGPFTTRWYNHPLLDGAGRELGSTTPVSSIAPASVIISPAPHEAVARGVAREVWGWAWADGGIRNLYVRTGGDTWRGVELEPPSRHEWERFSCRWTP